VIAATRLRGGSASAACGAASLITEAVSTARATACTGTLVVRMDSAFYGVPAAWAARNAGVFFSITMRMDAKVREAVASIPAGGWKPIRYPRATWDDQLGCWISDAQAAEVENTAFTSRKGKAITARLIVRRVKDLKRQGSRAGRAVHRVACRASGYADPAPAVRG
jgi:hypothetical protein